MIFLLFVECFFHIERSVTLRILVELLNSGNSDSNDLQTHYSTEDMVRQRLAVLEVNNFIYKTNDSWFLKPKGKFFAVAMKISSWLFQSASQHDRTE